MDDLEDLQARVSAAQEKLQLNADNQRKYGLRLNDIVTIVEGSLTRQREEMKRLQDDAVSLRIERDAMRVAESQTKSLYEATLVKLNQLQAQNAQLRNMVMTLLNVIEGRESALALQPILHRLEKSLQDITSVPAASDEAQIAGGKGDIDIAANKVKADDIESMTTEEIATELKEAGTDAEDMSSDSQTMNADIASSASAEDLGSAEKSDDEEAAGFDELATSVGIKESSATEEPSLDETSMGRESQTSSIGENVGDNISEQAATSEPVSDDMPEDLGEMSMDEHLDVVTDVDAIVASENADKMAEMNESAAANTGLAEKNAVQPSEQQNETLVSALLDAEKALIEAGASGVVNTKSPVADIIRRISLRTREFSEASGV